MEKKYILTDEEKTIYGHTLHRIKAIKDFGEVKAGDLGGWIESEENLSHEGLCWVGGEACVFENSRVCGDAQVYGDAKIFGRAQVYEQAWVSEYAFVHGYTRVFGDTWVKGDVQVFGNAQIYGNTRVFGNVRVCGDAQIYGDAQISVNAWIKENAFIQCNKDHLCIGPIGSRDDFTTFYRTKDQGIWVSCGCFIGSLEEFEKAVREAHKGTVYEKEYFSIIECAKIKMEKN